MKAEIILQIIFSLLEQSDVDVDKLHHASKCHLYDVAYNISTISQTEEDAAHLITIAYKESKFNYQVDDNVLSNHGACGIYQQIPKYTDHPTLGKLTCQELQDTSTATQQAIISIKKVFETYGKDLKNVCHYNAGNKCGVEAIKYANHYTKVYKNVVDKLKKNKAKKRDESIYSTSITMDSFLEMCEQGC